MQSKLRQKFKLFCQTLKVGYYVYSHSDPKKKFRILGIKRKFLFFFNRKAEKIKIILLTETGKKSFSMTDFVPSLHGIWKLSQ